MISGLDDLGAREVLLAAEEARRREMDAQGDMLALAAHWCDLHGPMDHDDQARVAAGAEQLVGIGGDGTPDVEEFAAAEFGAMVHLHPMAARNMMADALDLRHRLPQCWRATQARRLEVWVARKIASLTRTLSRSAAAYVDAAIADHLGALPAGRLLALVEAKIVEADPELAEARRREAEQTRFVRSTRDEHGLKTLIARATAGDVIVFQAMVDRLAEVLGARGDDDSADVRRSKAIGILARPAEALRLLLEAAHDAGVPDEAAEQESTGEPVAAAGPTLRELLATADRSVLRAPVRLFVHLTDDVIRGARSGVARVEGLGAVTVEQVREWLGRADVTATPVLDVRDQRPVDGYEFPARIREAAHQLHPADPFPWAGSTSRVRDGDHCREYVPLNRGGPPGQTSLENCALLGRHHHRIKTFGGWQLTCLSPGRFLWRSPHGFWFLVDQDGTHRVPDRLHVALRPEDDPARSVGEEQVVKLVIRAA
jgi:hypothetical protein